MMRICAECEDSFDDSSPAKKRAGGLKIHCPDCSVETVAKHAGVMAGDGKQASVQILAFEDPKDRERFVNYWARVTGLNRGKSCNLGDLPKPTTLKFKKVAEHGVGMNHKGRGDGGT